MNGPARDDGSYYAKGNEVWRAPRIVARTDSGRTFSMGFKVCTVEDHVGGAEGDEKSGAEIIAAALNLVNDIDVPELHDFAKAVVLEAQHQRARWDDQHDTNKTPAHWVALITHLAGKAIQASWDSDHDKLVHHIITIASVCNNWHSRVSKAPASVA